MTLSATDLKDLELALADRLYVQVASWHLYLGDAGLAQTLAIECSARVDQGAKVCARQALEAVQVPIGSGSTRLPLAGTRRPAKGSRRGAGAVLPIRLPHLALGCAGH
jgi:hypothetical protein